MTFEKTLKSEISNLDKKIKENEYKLFDLKLKRLSLESELEKIKRSDSELSIKSEEDMRKHIDLIISVNGV